MATLGIIYFQFKWLYTYTYIHYGTVKQVWPTSGVYIYLFK